MIGRPRKPPRAAVLLGTVAIAGVGALFALRPGDPAAADPAGEAARAAETRDRALAALELLSALDRQLGAAVAEIRAAAGHVSTGDSVLAGDALEMAARIVQTAAGDLAAAQSLLSELETRAGCVPRAPRVGDADLAGAENEVRAAMPLAESVAAVRRHADATVTGLTTAAAALDRGDVAAAAEAHAAARDALARARTAHGEVRPLMPTAATWFETTGELVDHLGDVIDATAAGDAAAAEAAVAAYQTAGERASLADRALAVGLADASASVLGPPVSELAELRNALGETAQELRAIADAGTCG